MVDLDKLEKEVESDNYNTGIALIDADKMKILITEIRALRAVRDAAEALKCGCSSIEISCGHRIDCKHITLRNAITRAGDSE